MNADESVDPASDAYTNVKLTPAMFDVTEMKVARLKGAGGEIFEGDSVPLVATASFRATAKFLQIMKDAGDAHFSIHEDGDVRSTSSNCVIPSHVLTKFLEENYSFDFSVESATGQQLPRSPDSVLQATSRKWVRVLQTAGLEPELLELDVSIRPMTSVVIHPAPAPGGESGFAYELRQLAVKMDTLEDCIQQTRKDVLEAIARMDKEHSKRKP